MCLSDLPGFVRRFRDNTQKLILLRTLSLFQAHYQTRRIGFFGIAATKVRAVKW